MSAAPAIDASIIAAVRAHARGEYPRECCGVVVVRKGRQRYIECRNMAGQQHHFAMDPQDYAAAEDEGEVLAIAHSHCNASPRASMADRVGCERSGKPWLIVSYPAGHHELLLPEGYRAPLVGREFAHGVLDCYSLIRDYYQDRLGIELPDYDRDDRWWLRDQNLYLEHYADAGFVRIGGADAVDQLKPHDMILMQVASQVPNHGGIYLGDMQILQHCSGRLSSRDVYGGYWQRCTSDIMRHEQVIARGPHHAA